METRRNEWRRVRTRMTLSGKGGFRERTLLFGGDGLKIEQIPLNPIFKQLLEARGLLQRTEPVVGYVDFTPGTALHSPNFRTEFLLAGHNDFKQFFNQIDSKRISPVDVFLGHTNSHMAKVAERLGFRAERMEPGPAVEEDEHLVYGLASDIRKKLLEFDYAEEGQESLMQKLKRRHERDSRIRSTS